MIVRLDATSTANGPVRIQHSNGLITISEHYYDRTLRRLRTTRRGGADVLDIVLSPAVDSYDGVGNPQNSRPAGPERVGVVLVRRSRPPQERDGNAGGRARRRMPPPCTNPAPPPLTTSLG